MKFYQVAGLLGIAEMFFGGLVILGGTVYVLDSFMFFSMSIAGGILIGEGVAKIQEYTRERKGVISSKKW